MLRLRGVLRRHVTPGSAVTGVIVISTRILLRLLVVVGLAELRQDDQRQSLKTRKPRPRREWRWMGRVMLWQLRCISALRRAVHDQVLQHYISHLLGRCASILSAGAQLSAAEKFLEQTLLHVAVTWEPRLDYVRTLGINRFMQGKMRAAMPCFAEVAETKRMLRKRPGVPGHVRILGPSWFVALGHVAMLDFLIKKKRLGWEPADTVYLDTRDPRTIPGPTLVREFQKLGMLFLWPEDVKAAFDGVVESLDRWAPDSTYLRPPFSTVETSSPYVSPTVSTTAPHRSIYLSSRRGPISFRKWDYLESTERSALVEEFWEMSFPDGDALPFSHAAAKIQNRWEAEERAPNLVRSGEADEALGILRRRLGIRDDAWYVCLHVRQSGFHRGWNARWEQARDAEITTYSKAIRAITDQGGYVVRMGDPTMPRLSPTEHVVDYAHTDLKSEYADMLLISGCRFFLGTNSGLSIVPGIYGVPCVLTNWVPIGIPNWFGKDLVIPKVMRRRRSGTFVSLDEMLGTDLGYMQNPRHLPPDVEFVDNSPEDLAFVVTQMLCELDDKADHVRDPAVEEAYFRLATRHGSYRGSRIGTAFIYEHGKALGWSWQDDRRALVEAALHPPGSSETPDAIPAAH